MGIAVFKSNRDPVNSIPIAFLAMCFYHFIQLGVEMHAFNPQHSGGRINLWIKCHPEFPGETLSQTNKISFESTWRVLIAVILSFCISLPPVEAPVVSVLYPTELARAPFVTRGRFTGTY